VREFKVTDSLGCQNLAALLYTYIFPRVQYVTNSFIRASRGDGKRFDGEGEREGDAVRRGPKHYLAASIITP
jgi:hypothetical protein